MARNKKRQQELNFINEEVDSYEFKKCKSSLPIREHNEFVSNKQVAKNIINKKINIRCKNDKQKTFLDIINENEITMCIGSAGVGKSYLSIAKALELLIDSENSYEKIYIMSPVVEAEDKIGFLKGSIEEKMSVYIYSTYYLIDKIIGKEAREKLVSAGIIETAILTYMRGMNIDNAILVSEESQNISKKGMKLLLSRIGYNSKFIISGDLEQSDKFRDVKDSGLYWALNKLKEIDGIGTCEFSKEDIVRNPIITKILDRLNEE